MALSSLQSADTSLQDQVSTAVEAQEEPTISPKPQVDVDLMTSGPVASTREQLPSAETETSTETSTLTVNGNTFNSQDSGAVLTTLTPVDMDQPTGSGMLPSSSEEEGAFPTSPVGQPEEAQSTAENEHLNKTVEADGDGRTTDSKENTTKLNPSTNGCSSHQEQRLLHYY